MIEITLLNYLKSHTIINVPVYMEIPQKPPISFITIEKIEAGKKDKINASTFSVNAYADTLYKAVELSENIKKAMEELGETTSLVFSCKFGGENNNTDLANKKYCYNTVWNIYH